MTQLFPEKTIEFRTYAKQTLVQAFKEVFKDHPDELLRRTNVTVEFPRTEADYPSLVVRFAEREIRNAGVGHQEILHYRGISDSVEFSVKTDQAGRIDLTWEPIENAVEYVIYKGHAQGQQNEAFFVAQPSFSDTGAIGAPATPSTYVTTTLPMPVVKPVSVPEGTLNPGSYWYRVAAISPLQALKFGHYFYNSDVEFVIYGLSAYDRDLVADSVVQTLAMGRLDEYTNNFFDRVYADSDLYPYSQLHFINVNTDRIMGSGETQEAAPWGAEDSLIYSISYRCGIFGEFYSLPPKATYAIVKHVTIYPYIEGFDTPGAGIPFDSAPWVSNEGY